MEGTLSASPDSVTIARALATWPEIRIGARAFDAYLAERLPLDDGERPSPTITSERLAELYIACACALGDRAAIEAFEAAYFDQVDRVAARMRSRGIRRDDLRQHIRDRLFVSPPGSLPRIATYSGHGELRGWLRATAMRAALNMIEASARDQDRSDESVLLQLPDIADDPELALMKRRYRAEFDAAVGDAFATLASRERNLLRYAVIKKLSTEAIGAIYDVHRTTAGRWLEDAQSSFLSAIRRSMMARLRVSPSELESILRLVRSRLELTLSDYATATDC